MSTVNLHKMFSLPLKHCCLSWVKHSIQTNYIISIEFWGPKRQKAVFLYNTKYATFNILKHLTRNLSSGKAWIKITTLVIDLFTRDAQRSMYWSNRDPVIVALLCNNWVGNKVWLAGLTKVVEQLLSPPFDLPTNHSFFWGNCTNNVCFRTFIWCLSLQVSRKRNGSRTN